MFRNRYGEAKLQQKQIIKTSTNQQAIIKVRISIALLLRNYKLFMIFVHVCITDKLSILILPNKLFIFSITALRVLNVK